MFSLQLFSYLKIEMTLAEKHFREKLRKLQTYTEDQDIISKEVQLIQDEREVDDSIWGGVT